MNSDTRYAAGMPYSQSERMKFRNKAERRLEQQATRLGTTPESILEAIRSQGWLWEQIQSVTSRYELEGLPPPLSGVHSDVDARISEKLKAKEVRKAA